MQSHKIQPHNPNVPEPLRGPSANLGNVGRVLRDAARSHLLGEACIMTIIITININTIITIITIITIVTIIIIIVIIVTSEGVDPHDRRSLRAPRRRSGSAGSPLFSGASSLLSYPSSQTTVSCKLDGLTTFHQVHQMLMLTLLNSVSPGEFCICLDGKLLVTNKAL